MSQLMYFGCHGGGEDNVPVYCEIKRKGVVLLHLPFNLWQGSVSFDARAAELYEPLEFYASDPRISWRAEFRDGSERFHTGSLESSSLVGEVKPNA
jgi:hypothetical protein